MADSSPRRTKFILDEDRIPRTWYNIAADLPVPPEPVLHPGTGQPIGPSDLAPLFPMALIGQVVSKDREIEIPEPVRRRLPAVPAEPAVPGASARAGARYAGPHLLQVRGRQPVGQPQAEHRALPQAYYNKAEGVTRLATETGAGPVGQRARLRRRGLRARGQGLHGPRELRPEAVPADPHGDVRRPGRRQPERLTPSYGRKVLAETPDHTGSLGLAISEAIEDTVTHPGTKYSLGSVFDFVLLHQTVIGQETILQMEMAGEEPDVIIGCAGGGSNFAGLAFPWLGRTFRGGGKYRVIAVEPEAAPSLTRGVYAYDFGDTAQMTPLVKMHTLGHDFIPEPIHAGGLRYHGMSPLVSLLKEHGYIEALSVHQRASFESGVQFARTEGILPAPEPTHAINIAIDEALAAKAAGESRVILFNLCGHGHFDLSAYERYLSGQLEDYEYPAEKVEAALAALPTGLTPRFIVERGGSIRTMPRLACWSCGRQIYTTSPIESLFAEERRCPRCGAYLNPERREIERRERLRRMNPVDEPGPPQPTERAPGQRSARRPASVGRIRERVSQRSEPAGWSDWGRLRASELDRPAVYG